MTDDQFNQMKNNPSNGELGVVVKGGKIYNRSESGELIVVGLYQRTSFDDQNDFFNGVIFGTRSTRGLVEQAPVAGKTAMVLWGGSVIAGTTGGAGLYALGSGGSGLTTLGTLGQVATPAAGTGAAVLNQLSRTDASIFQQASQFGASATNAFMSNVSALAQAVASKIPGGQINVIGQIGNSPIYGSVVSRVGIAQVDGVTVVVKMVHGQPQVLGPLP